MELKGTKLYIAMAITFVILFLMNYIGNSEASDRLSRAILIGAAGAIGLGISFWLSGRGKNNNDHQEFD
ncbi:MAG: hypothetical protein JSS94_03255 [Bacteroidetes bacterium]|nr:hypothetical protein [Bacteroidota bacterium]